MPVIQPVSEVNFHSTILLDHVNSTIFKMCRPTYIVPCRISKNASFVEFEFYTINQHCAFGNQPCIFLRINPYLIGLINHAMSMHRRVNDCFVGAGRRLRVFAGGGGGLVIESMPKMDWLYTFKGFCEGGFSPQTPLLTNIHAPFHAVGLLKTRPTDPGPSRRVFWQVESRW